MSPDVLSVEQVADLLGLGRNTVLELAGRGVIPSMPIGRDRRFIRARVDAARGKVREALVAMEMSRPLVDLVKDEMVRLRRCAAYKPIGWIYAIRCDVVGLTKIGKAVDPVPRIAGLERMNAAPLRLLGLAHGSRHEAALHRKFASQRVRGEWFAIDENPIPFNGQCFTCRGMV